MYDRTLVVSTCGISIFINSSKNKNGGILSKYSNATSREEIPSEDLSILDDILDSTRKLTNTQSLQELSDLSSELNTLFALYNYNPPKDHVHILICTDTWLGYEAVSILQTILKRYVSDVRIEKVKDLQTRDLERFQSSLSDIVRCCSETLKGYREKGYKIIFNLTGGFKSFQGFMQTLAMFYADETIYIFEGSDSLLRIPSLPIEMKDTQFVSMYLKTFRKLRLGIAVSKEEASKLPGVYIFQLEDSIALTPWGDIIWGQEYEEIYRQKLHESPSPLISYSDKFLRSTRNLDPDRYYDLNKKIDLLARYLHSDRKDMPKALDLKALKGSSKLVSTHEFDAWADKGAWRVFCHFSGEQIILDELAKGLH